MRGREPACRDVEGIGMIDQRLIAAFRELGLDASVFSEGTGGRLLRDPEMVAGRAAVYRYLADRPRRMSMNEISQVCGVSRGAVRAGLEGTMGGGKC